MARQRAANARMNVVWATTAATGPVLGGIVVAAIGSPIALLIDVASFLICSFALLGVHGTRTQTSGSVHAHLTEAWRHVSSIRALRLLLVTEAVALVFFASVEPVEVIYARSTLGTGDVGYGVLLAVWGVGMILGGVIFARGKHLALGGLLVGGSLAVAAAYLGMAAAPTLAIACLAAVVGGAGNGVQWASLISAVQQMTPDRLFGRVMGVVEAIGSLCPALGFVLGGVIAATLSPRAAFTVAGAGALLAAAVLARVARGGLSGGRADGDGGRDDAASATGPGAARALVTLAAGDAPPPARTGIAVESAARSGFARRRRMRPGTRCEPPGGAKIGRFAALRLLMQ